MKRADRYWCEQRRRWLLYICRIGEFFLFEDYTHAHLLLTAEEVERLKPDTPPTARTEKAHDTPVSFCAS